MILSDIDKLLRSLVS